MKKAIVCFCALGALCLLCRAPALAQEMSMGMGGGDSEATTVSVSAIIGGSGGGGGSSEEENRTISHARSRITSTLAYDALELTVDAEPSATLTVGGVPLELALTAEDGTAQAFTASFIPWPDAAQADGGTEAEPTETALLLTAEAGATGSWTFPGATLRKMLKSGVSKLVLAAGERKLIRPTAGFLGGYHYDQWRSAGVAAKDIRYTVAADALPPLLRAAVNAESYPADADTESMLYYAGITSQGSGVNTIE